MSTNLLEKSVFMHSLVGEKSPKKRCWSGFWKVELKILTGLWCFWSLMWLLASRLRPRKLISLVNVRSHFLKVISTHHHMVTFRDENCPLCFKYLTFLFLSSTQTLKSLMRWGHTHIEYSPLSRENYVP